MNLIKKLLRAIDRYQQERSWLAVAFATYKKFSDNQAGNLAALIAYYAFASVFPLLLVFVTILNIALKNDPSLHRRLLNTALKQLPGISQHYNVNHTASGSGVALLIGLLLTFYGARGVASAIQNALNSVWEVPMAQRPGFPWGTLRSLGLVLVMGPGLIVTITLSGIAGGTGHLGGAFAKIAAAVVALLLNVGLFWLGSRLATAGGVTWRELRLGAILAAVAWQILQLAAGTIVAHLSSNSSQYGIFGVVLGLLAWFYLQAQLTLYVAELNVVRVRRLWPRSLAPPPVTDADERAYAMYAQAQARRKDVEVAIQVNPPADPDGPTRLGGDVGVTDAAERADAGAADADRADADGAEADRAKADGTAAAGNGSAAGHRRPAAVRQYATRALNRIRRR